MIKPENFTMDIGVLKWSWLRPGETGNLRIDVLNWQNPEEVLKSVQITDQLYRSYYMRSGFVPPVMPGLPVVIRVEEQVNGSEPCSFIHTILDPKKYPIKWDILKDSSSIWEIRITYPDPTVVSPDTYPENMLSLLVQAPGETPEQGARFCLPRPSGSRVQSFWFDSRNGYSVSLQLDKELPLGRSGLLKVSDAFTLRRS